MEEKETKQKLINATLELLQDCTDVQKLTLRQIAEKAGVALGLINYYFGSKDKLIYLAMGDAMGRIANERLADDAEGDARGSLREMLLTLYRFSVEYRSLMPYLVLQTLRSGNRGAELTMLPLLRKIRPDEDEMRLRITAMQIMAPIQVSALDADSFRLYGGIDLDDETSRARFIDMLLDILEKGEK